MLRRHALVAADLIDSSSVACTAGQFTKLGEYQVEAGEVVFIGYGAQSGQDNAQGRIYIKLQTSGPAEISGLVRISLLGPQNTYIEEIGQWRTEALSSSTDRTKQVPLPLLEPGASEDKKIVLEFDPDSTSTVSKADSTVRIDTSRELV